MFNGGWNVDDQVVRGDVRDPEWPGRLPPSRGLPAAREACCRAQRTARPLRRQRSARRSGRGVPPPGPYRVRGGRLLHDERARGARRRWPGRGHDVRRLGADLPAQRAAPLARPRGAGALGDRSELRLRAGLRRRSRSGAAGPDVRREDDVLHDVGARGGFRCVVDADQGGSRSVRRVAPDRHQAVDDERSLRGLRPGLRGDRPGRAGRAQRRPLGLSRRHGRARAPGGQRHRPVRRKRRQPRDHLAR